MGKRLSEAAWLALGWVAYLAWLHLAGALPWTWAEVLGSGLALGIVVVSLNGGDNGKTV